MTDEFMEQSDIQDVLSRYLEKEDKRSDKEFSRIETIEEAAEKISKDYDRLHGRLTPRGEDPSARRGADYSFIEAYSEVNNPYQDLSPVERRIMQSDYLTLHYAIVGGTIDNLMSAYLEQLTPDQREILERDDTKVLKVGAEIAEEFVIRQRKKSKESELLQTYPDAPTTGFEFEYIDTLRAIADRIVRIPQEVKILKAVKEDNYDELESLVQSTRNNHFLQELLEEKIPSIMMDDIGLDEYIDFAINIREETFDDLLRITQAPYNIKGAFGDESDFRDYLMRTTRERIMQIQSRLEDYGLEEEDVEKTRMRLQRQFDLVEGKIDFEAGDVIDPDDLSAIRLLVRSPAGRLSQLGPMSAMPEFFIHEEVVTKPSVSVRMQLRDFVYAAKMGAFTESLSVHQTIGGIELSPDDTEFMEVTAILNAAHWNDSLKAIPDKALEFIEAGISVYADPFKKISLSADGKEYLFARHRNRSTADADAYPSESRPLLEMRAMRAFHTQDSFASHVRASTFTWLAAWGKQAANIAASDRTEQQAELADAWQLLLSDWGELLASKEVYQPKGDERYQEVVRKDGKISYEGEEKYSLYLQQIAAKRVRESISLSGDMENSLQSQSRKLIREYNRKVKKMIGY